MFDVQRVLSVPKAIVLVMLACSVGAGAQTSSTQKKPAPKKPSKPAVAAPAPKPAVTPSTSPGTGPILVMETVKGTMEIETYPEDAPKTVAHIVALVKKGFYNGVRFHRVVPNFVIQGGDPQSRDMTKRDLWGIAGPQSGSGKPIGVAELSKRRLHRIGAVAMAHAGDPRLADSQFYIVIGPASHLDGRHVVFGQVIAGTDVPAKIQAADAIKKVSLKAAAPAGALKP